MRSTSWCADLRVAPPVSPRRVETVVQLPARAAVAAALVVAAAALLRLQYPLYALITAVIVTDLVPGRTRQLAVPRFLGSLAGATIGAALTYLLDPGPIAAGAAVLAAAAAISAL